jgi:hypothetical protein
MVPQYTDPNDPNQLALDRQAQIEQLANQPWANTDPTQGIGNTIPYMGTDPNTGSNQTTGSTTETAKATLPGDTTASQSQQNNQDQFYRLLTDPKYKGNPQGAIDAFNALKLGKDSTGLSSNYGSSPEYYGDNNTIGLPGGYYTQGNDGSWNFTQRTASNQGHGEPASALLGAAPLVAPGLTIGANDSGNVDSFLAGILNYARSLALGGSGTSPTSPEGANAALASQLVG